MAAGAKPVEGRLVGVEPRALIKHRSVPEKTEAFQCPQDVDVRAFHIARCIEVLDPYQPLAAVLPRVNVTRNGRDQRPEVQRPGWRWRESANVTHSNYHRLGSFTHHSGIGKSTVGRCSLFVSFTSSGANSRSRFRATTPANATTVRDSAWLRLLKPAGRYRLPTKPSAPAR